MIRDLSSSAELKVYMNLERSQYPLGLLPGAVVRMDRLHRRTALNGNGAVYFVFSVASLCQVVSLAGSRDSCQLDHR